MVCLRGITFGLPPRRVGVGVQDLSHHGASHASLGSGEDQGRRGAGVQGRRGARECRAAGHLVRVERLQVVDALHQQRRV
eukprot:2199061-Prymnesium_polylepis.4